MPTINELFDEEQRKYIKETCDLLQSEGEVTALEMACRLKRAEAFLTALREGLRPKANADFTAIRTESPDRRTWPISDVAVISAYVPKSSWIYPSELLAQHTELKNKMQDSRERKEARKITPELDTEKDTLFSISLNEKFSSK